MTSGYELSPDYSDPRPTPLWFWLLLIAFALLLMLRLHQTRDRQCWMLSEQEVVSEENGGKQFTTLNLDRIPKGECVMIDTK